METKWSFFNKSMEEEEKENCMREKEIRLTNLLC